MTPLWQLFVSGAVGSSLTYALTWWREHKRIEDARRAPQRQAIGDILAAGHELQLRVLNWRRVMADLIDEIRQERADNLTTIGEKICETESVYATALLDMRHAFEIGSLTVVDAKCWHQMVIAVAAFSRFDNGPNVRETLSADAAEEFVARLGERADELREALSVLVKTANDRVTPVESRRGRRRRRDAQRRLAAHLR